MQSKLKGFCGCDCRTVNVSIMRSFECFQSLKLFFVFLYNCLLGLEFVHAPAITVDNRTTVQTA